MQTIHQQCANAMKEIDIESLKTHHSSAGVNARKQMFMDSCIKLVRDASKPGTTAEFGLSEPMAEKINEAWLVNYMEKKYAEVLTRVDKTILEEKEDRKKKEKEKIESDKKLLAAKPAQLLEKVISDLVKKEVGNNMEVDAEKEGAEQFVDAMRKRASAEDAKNGDSPGWNRGKNQKKGKGKGMNYNKGKGKGSGKGKSAGKGKKGWKGAWTSPGKANHKGKAGKGWQKGKSKGKGQGKMKAWKPGKGKFKGKGKGKGSLNGKWNGGEKDEGRE